MNKIYFILPIIVLFISCKKENEQINNEVSYPDQISYLDIPDFILSSTDSVYYIPFGQGCPIAAPVDSTVEYSIDLDSDGTDDFLLRMTHWYDFVNASSPCINYNYSIHIEGIVNENYVATTGIYNVATHFNIDQEIGASINWNNTASLFKQGGTAPFSTNFNGVTYIGLKLGAGPHIGWLLLDKDGYTMTIKEMAINLTNNNSILAGQKE